MKRFIKTLSAAAAICCGAHVSAEALIIKVTDPGGGGDFAGMNAVVEEVRGLIADNPSGAVPAVINGFEVLVTEGNEVPTSLSMTPGTSAVFWSDKGTRYESGFSANGGTVRFRTAETPSVRPEARDAETESAPMVFANRLAAATATDARLSLRYSSSGPGKVQVELYDLNGLLLKRWTWHEEAAGMQTRTLDVAGTGNGIRFIVWSQGDYRSTRRLTFTQKR